MMAARLPDADNLIARLPAVRGDYRALASLADLTWFRVGGPAEVLFRPADADDLAAFLRAKPADLPVLVIGVGSNLLVRDGGVPGVVVRLAKGFSDIRSEGSTIEAGAGAGDVRVAMAAQQAGIAGLEFLRGIPGTIGGGLRMNAGAYGREMKDILLEAEAIDGNGNLHRLSREELHFGYRHCGVPEDWIFLRAWLKGELGNKAAIAERMAAIQSAREESQPIKTATGGSTFANPPGLRAWELIDRAGCRGLRIGGAQVSEQHCNFLINHGNASAADLEKLGETVRERVMAVTGVELRWEIRRVGLPLAANDSTLEARP